MSVSLWIIFIIFGFVLGSFCAIIVMIKQGKKEYGEGYTSGFKNGAKEQYNGDFNRRLLKQSRRAAGRNQCITSDIEQSGVIPEEKKNEPTNTEVGPGELQGNPVSSDSELFGGSGIVRSDDVDAGAGEVPPAEGGSGVSEPDERG